MPENHPTMACQERVPQHASRQRAAREPAASDHSKLREVPKFMTREPAHPTASAPTLAGQATSPIADWDYAAALEYLYSRINYEKIGSAAYTAGNFRLDRMRHLLRLLGDPQLDYPIIHIAGTKGKGTTANLLADALAGCGRTVGLYTSPHLRRLEERIQVQGKPCSPQELVELTVAVRAAAELLVAESGSGGPPTFFELTTAMGFLHFSRRRVDSVVLEVGLGGRLDSTNVCTPVVTVITSISLDHQAQLGSTIAEIAGEKAGIIKSQVPVICSARHPDARARIEQQAAKMRAPLWLIGRDFESQWQAESIPEETTPGAFAEDCTANDSTSQDSTWAAARVRFRTQSAELAELDGSQWPLRLLGSHHGDNLAAALATLQTLRNLGWQLPPETLTAAIARSHPPARLEVVSARPLSVLDTAHNPASIRAGLAALGTHFPRRALMVLFATSRDKDYREMLREILPMCRALVLTAFQTNPRALPIEELSQAAKRVADELQLSSPPAIHLSQSPAEGWRQVRQLAADRDLVYATGSFFLAAEILDARTEQDGP